MAKLNKDIRYARTNVLFMGLFVLVAVIGPSLINLI